MQVPEVDKRTAPAMIAAMGGLSVLRSAVARLDFDLHEAWLRQRFGAAALPVVRDDWASIARGAASLRRSDRGTLVALGGAALLASVAWRGTVIFVPSAPPTSMERWTLGRRMNVVVADALPTAIGSNDLSIDAARGAVGVERGATVVHLAGAATPTSNHRLAIWTAAVLAYRDASWRFLLDARGRTSFVRDFIHATAASRPHSFRIVPARLGEAAARAADVTLWCGARDDEPAIVARARAAGSRVVAPASCAISAATATFEAMKPRDAARAIFRALDLPAPVPAGPSPESIDAGWSALLDRAGFRASARSA